ncbi:MAG TPA: ectonucleotide pyrophosphatase/phosphodiesterase [Gemmatimonadales bacterium]|jgi:predicted AlkP superfamily pyrophosphatase or phosphodiesterase|nr:ectonucleotide pyrophosphatase/phosphodiesterase [Gemmatimonadales bacterium]
MNRTLLAVLVALAAAAAGAGARAAPRPRVVLISVDGLWARDLQRAESLGVRLPVLDSLRREGAFAAGVIGSFPSVTYPSHTTMVTGVPPARHGVYSNGRFFPPTDTTRIARSYWEAEWVRVPGLFEAARAAGLKTAAVNWPVTAHHGSIDYNIPDAWDPRMPDSVLVALRRLGTPWLLDSLGAPRGGGWSDSLRARWTGEIVRRWDPDFVLLHLLDLDHWKHEQGPVGDSVWVALRGADRYIGWLLSALRERPRATTVIVTSDHGFLPHRQQVRVGVLLARAGLVTLDSGGRVTAWDAAVFSNGGSVMILPRDSTDRGLAARIRAAIPDSLVGPGRPVRAVWLRDTVAALGGDPRALWALDMNEGFYAAGGYRGALIGDRLGGAHGYDPRRAELHAFFLAVGPGIRRGSRLPVIRQVDIAPTVAKVLGLRLEGVEGRPVF